MKISAIEGALGARVEGRDLSQPLKTGDVRTILKALGQYGVLCFPKQSLEPAELAEFGAAFGTLEVNVANAFQAPGLPEVMFLSNMKSDDGRALGLNDAGQGWHTDMSYSHDIALANVLHAKHVPMRDGRPLGDTQFRNMHAAYDDLPDAIKQELAGRTAIHDFEKFWEMVRTRASSNRPKLTAEQKAKKPPISQPLFRLHPITGKRVLYCNPGYTMYIEGMERAKSDDMLDMLFAHQAQPKYLYSHHWTKQDVLMWDNIGTTHNAVADYGPDDHRMIHRVQVMASMDYAALVA